MVLSAWATQGCPRFLNIKILLIVAQERFPFSRPNQLSHLLNRSALLLFSAALTLAAAKRRFSVRSHRLSPATENAVDRLLNKITNR